MKVSEQYRALAAERKHLTSGQFGVFSEYWRASSEVPEDAGNYLVGIGNDEPIIASYAKGSGWDLDAGVQGHVRCWMPLPITLKEAK